MALEDRIAPTLEAMGFEVVRVALLNNGGQRTVQVMADRADGTLISIDECEAISNALSAIFDVEEPIAGAYDLEVSSAGIDRPLTRPKDFETYAGFEAKIETKLAVNGRRRFKGPVKGLSETGDAVITVDGADVALPVANIASAKLILTNDLIAATAKGKPQKANERKAK
ncbi:MAG: ribosome maturation factor RimP [Rhodospirillaceae bacterium]|nr:ribosome maturation factor RimP [Rhodospirillaceae bacterium]